MIKWKRPTRALMAVIVAFVLTLAGVGSYVTYNSPGHQSVTTQVVLGPAPVAAAAPTVPPGHQYQTDKVVYTCLGKPYCDMEIYVDETWRSMDHPEDPSIKKDGVPELVTKLQVGDQVSYSHIDLCPQDGEAASYWWNTDRSKTEYLSNYWHYVGGSDPHWEFHAPQPEGLTIRFGWAQVSGGDLIGGETRARTDATVRCVSPLWDFIEPRVAPPPPPDQSSAACPSVAGVQTSPIDGGCLFKSPDSSPRTFSIPPGWHGFDGQNTIPSGIQVTVLQLSLYPG